jgi:hypothetical protein
LRQIGRHSGGNISSAATNVLPITMTANINHMPMTSSRTLWSFCDAHFSMAFKTRLAPFPDCIKPADAAAGTATASLTVPHLIRRPRSIAGEFIMRMLTMFGYGKVVADRRLRRG